MANLQPRGHDLLVVLMHQGGVDPQDRDGTEAWVLDRSTQRRIGRITFEAPGSGLLVVESDEPLLLAAIGGSVHVFDLATGVGTALLMAAYGGAITLNLLRGGSWIDCGCGCGEQLSSATCRSPCSRSHAKWAC